METFSKFVYLELMAIDPYFFMIWQLQIIFQGSRCDYLGNLGSYRSLKHILFKISGKFSSKATLKRYIHEVCNLNRSYGCDSPTHKIN